MHEKVTIGSAELWCADCRDVLPDRHKSRQMSELMRLRASDLRELAEKMRVVLAYDPAMTIRANEVACAADAIDEWAKGLR